MRVREMHPLCCISLDCPAAGDVGSDSSPAPEAVVGEGVEGALYKWTNYRKGWRCRWFLLRDGVLSYSKSRSGDATGGVRVIGKPIQATTPARKKRISVIQFKISSVRESRSDDKRFYIFTDTKTLHLRAEAEDDRAAWIGALVSTRGLTSREPLISRLSFIRNGVSISTTKLRERLLLEGLNEDAVKDCESIVLSEVSELEGQLKLLYEDRLNLIGTLRQLEEASTLEASGIHEGRFLLTTHKNLSSGSGKCSECSVTESSDDTERQDFEELLDGEQCSYFDAVDYFSDCTDSDTISSSKMIERRTRLPDPMQKEKGVSLWSMIKDNVGKDLSRVCLPVYFNEPISSLQKCFEDMEYSHLLDQAYEYGKMGNSLMRILKVAAFATSGYASSEGRHCKPFNPLLGETYEADYPERGIRFFSEKVSHHPMLIACYCEGKGWKFWGESNIRSKFWGRSIQLDPVGVLTLEFDDGEIFQWSKVTTTIYNLILGKIYCEHHGTMQIVGNRQYSCNLRFKEQTLLDRNPRQVQGFVEDVNGSKVASLLGKWDDSMYYVLGDGSSKSQETIHSKDGPLLWRRNKPPANATRYNLTSFAITLNELTPGLKEKLPPTDSRLRPDQRHLENGEYTKADTEKLRLEKRQRMSRKLQDSGWTPRWFYKDGKIGQYRYIGGYWEAREQNKWEGCPNIFDDISEYKEL